MTEREHEPDYTAIVTWGCILFACALFWAAVANLLSGF